MDEKWFTRTSKQKPCALKSHLVDNGKKSPRYVCIQNQRVFLSNSIWNGVTLPVMAKFSPSFGNLKCAISFQQEYDLMTLERDVLL